MSVSESCKPSVLQLKTRPMSYLHMYHLRRSSSSLPHRPCAPRCILSSQSQSFSNTCLQAGCGREVWLWSMVDTGHKENLTICPLCQSLYVPPHNKRIRTTKDVLSCVQHFRNKKQEHLICLSLDSGQRLIARRVVTIGL